ncbi:hypothetical protein TTHT_1288 [Thermotomaculum hydrothermale]|uniref:Uncharacterized protein n=1 Tax=Thermotomaculum hydrothermale TaxID=981385 RepID=A0A7R6SZF8_9BACT|nr:hypothetical protein [Thermotomaculum hydrothermale]BBB32805.1 hypothetical protein TTHT_1288 [Thermotomaculum hydrothermale]
MRREYNLVFKTLIVVFLIGLPYLSYVAIKSMVERKGREIKRIESEILRTKKSINNLERIFSERIDYKKVESKAKQMGFDYINPQRNKIFVVKD